MGPDLSGLLVPELVADQAARAGEACAVATADEVLTYRELNRRADRLAERLRGLGVGRNVPVGLLAERSPSLLVGALGIMRAGGAYLPLDPVYPQDRLNFMLEDSRAAVLVTTGKASLRGTPAGCRVVSLGEDADPDRQPDSLPVPAAGPDPQALAYVVYTSGSTGLPKGVGVTHAALLNLVTWHHRAFAVTAGDRATQLASPAFDGAVWEIWPYLTAGAALAIPDDLTRLDPERLRDWLVRERITIGFAPTTLAEGLMALAWPVETSLRTLLTGGDALHVFPSAELPFAVVNNYGPTEATVVATSGVVPAGGDGASVPSIGRPIDGVELHVVDQDLELVARGEVGELLIGGAGLARGYLYREELNRQKFIANPFSGDPGSRLYRTGDMVRRLPSGELEFLGRVDDQVQIRGQRVELGEIAGTLDRHPAIRSSVVVAVGDESQGTRLVAYAVPAGDGLPDPETLRGHLARSLPLHMLPAEFVALSEIPVTPNGKVDREALPRPAAVAAPAPGRGPDNAVEAALVEIVAELLLLPTVATDENFFMLGGHSLLGAQLIARVEELYRVQLPLRTVFDGPTVQEIAFAIEEELLAQVSGLSEDEAARLAAVSPEPVVAVGAGSLQALR
ncbi:MAG TPA: amino acid adenylation domain-containing protein [Candidatus Dormibacteraeota bacterium]